MEWFKNNEKDGKWEHIECIAKTINTREINDLKTEQTKYYVSSTKMSADEMNKIVRDHWQIENNLHWVLDVTFKEDLSRSKTGNLMENFSLLRKMCLNIIKQDDCFGKISIKRKMNRYKFHENAFRDLLFEVIPNMNNLVNDKKC